MYCAALSLFAQKTQLLSSHVLVNTDALTSGMHVPDGAEAIH